MLSNCAKCRCDKLWQMSLWQKVSSRKYILSQNKIFFVYFFYNHCFINPFSQVWKRFILPNGLLVGLPGYMYGKRGGPLQGGAASPFHTNDPGDLVLIHLSVYNKWLLAAKLIYFAECWASYLICFSSPLSLLSQTYLNQHLPRRVAACSMLMIEHQQMIYL